MQIAKITRVTVNPPQQNVFTVDIAWKYPDEVVWKNAGQRTAVPNGTFNNEMSIAFDENISPTINIRLTYVGCATTVPYIYNYTGNPPITTTTTAAPLAKMVINSTMYQVDFALDGNTQIVEASGNQPVAFPNASTFTLNMVEFGNVSQINVTFVKNGQNVTSPRLTNAGESFALPAPSEYDIIQFDPA